MGYLSLETIHIDPNKYPNYLATIKITMFGECNMLDIYFSASDVERCFGIKICHGIRITRARTYAGFDSCLCYGELRRVLASCDDPLAAQYMQWVNYLLFGDSTIVPFDIIRSDASTIMDPNEDDLYTDVSSLYDSDVSSNDSDTVSDLDDRSDIDLSECMPDLEYTISLLSALKYRVLQLEYDNALKDKKIELLQIKLQSIPTKSEWI